MTRQLTHAMECSSIYNCNVSTVNWVLFPLGAGSSLRVFAESPIPKTAQMETFFARQKIILVDYHE